MSTEPGNTFHLYFQTTNKVLVGEFAVGMTLLDAIRRLGYLDLPAICGGRGTCKKCLVDVDVYGRVLACQTRPNQTVRVKPVIDDLTVSRLSQLEIQAALPDYSWGDNLPDTISGLPAPHNAIAIDIGTTTIAAVLLNLDSGELLGEQKARNHQRNFGADVISRIQYSNEHGLEILSGLLQNQILDMITSLLIDTGLDENAISALAICGNTTMEHFLTGLSPSGIGVSPFTTQSLFGKEISADQIGLKMIPNKKVYLLPAIAAYVGGDISAAVLCSGMYRKKEISCLLDIGTNGEMVIGSSQKIYACATAAGPAFEGAEIEQGMMGIPGAVSEVRFVPGSDQVFQYQVIGNVMPQGFCGSGLIDMLAASLEAGLLEDTGAIADRSEICSDLHRYLAEDRIFLDPEKNIYITQKDIRKLQVAKAAICAGLRSMLEEIRMTPQNVATFYLAGGFGSATNVSSLATIGMIPHDFSDKVSILGNAALSGTVLSMASSGAREELDSIQKNCTYIELSSYKAFADHYIDSMLFEIW